MAEVIPKPTLLYGTFVVSSASVTQVIPISGMSSSGVVSVIYLHSTTGGAGQFLKSITPSTNQISTLWGVSCAIGESIRWNVLSFS